MEHHYEIHTTLYENALLKIRTFILDEPRKTGSQHGYDPIFAAVGYDAGEGAGATLRKVAVAYTCIADCIRVAFHRVKIGFGKDKV